MTISMQLLAKLYACLCRFGSCSAANLMQLQHAQHATSLLLGGIFGPVFPETPISLN